MYTIVSGTNRPGSYTYKIAKEYERILKEKNIHANLFSLEGIDLLHYDAAFEKIEKEIIIPSENLIFIVPEYNGSFPGALKLLFDTSASYGIWSGKKALLTGISSGRAGNLRGMDHLTGVLHYLKMTVHHNKLPISAVDTLFDEEGKLKDKATLAAINQQLDEFVQWCSDHHPSK